MHKQKYTPGYISTKKHQLSFMHCSEAVELYSVVHLIFPNIVTVKSKLGKLTNTLRKQFNVCFPCIQFVE